MDDEQAIERYRQDTPEQEPRARRQVWRATARLTGDPATDKATRDAMLDKLHESLTAAQRATSDLNRSIRRGVEAFDGLGQVIGDGGVEVIVGEPIREIEPPTPEGSP